MTALFAIRHPETTWNAEGRYQGGLDAPWSGTGQGQARLLARAFQGCPIAAVYTSPLERASGLARQIASAADAPLEADDRLREIAMGQWEGLYRKEIIERFPDIFRDWYAAPDTVSFPGGETLATVASRARSLVADIFARYPTANVVVVSHSAVIGTLVLDALGLPLSALHRIHLANGGVSTICGGAPPGALLSLNVTEFLYQSPVAAAAAQNCASWKEATPTL